jgi:hypothetical protein
MMDILGWLQNLGKDASPAPGFQAQPLYLVMSIVLPVTLGLFVGFSVRLLERVFGVELGKRGAH